MEVRTPRNSDRLTTHGTLPVGREETRVEAVAEIPKARDTRLLEACDGGEAVDDSGQRKQEATGMVRMCCTKKTELASV